MISYTEQTCLSGFPTASTWVRSLVKSSCLHSVASSWVTVRTDGRLQLQDKSTVWHGQRSMEVHTKPTHQFNQDQHSPVRAQWVKRHGRVKERVRWRWGWVNKMLWAIHFDLYVKKKTKKQQQQCFSDNDGMDYLHGCVWRWLHANLTNCRANVWALLG